MRPTSIWAFLLVAGAWAFLAHPAHAQQGKGVKNTAGQEWLVRYHLNDPNRCGDIALRLSVQQGGGNSKSLAAKLSRYDDKTNTQKYAPRLDGGAVVQLTGNIVANQEESEHRKRETFKLAGTYVNTTDGTTHDVTVLGFHYAGRKKGAADRDDDQLVIRVIDKVHTDAITRALTTEPCDEQPPDEDVLTEGPPSDPPDYDPDNP